MAPSRKTARAAIAAALSLAALAAPAPAAAAAQRLAVLTLTAPWSPDCQGTAWRRSRVLLERCTVLETLADEARSGALAALEGRGVDVMTRENTAQLLKEMGTGASCSEGECEVETAKLIGADYVVSGNLVLVERTWFVTMKLHEVRTARLLRTSRRIKAATQVQLIEAVRPVSEELVRAGLGAPAQPAPVAPAAPAAPTPVARAEARRAPAPAAAADPQRPSPLAAWIANQQSEGMVRLGGGTFTMGRRGDAVTVAPFLLDAREVTVAAYGACVASGRCSADGLACGEGANFGDPRRGDHPVNCVSWFQAEAYCAEVGRRLPTEEEWEWAARGEARGTSYPWGDEVPGSQLCWDGDGSDVGMRRRSGTCPAGSHAGGASPQGVRDLAGNVAEWTSSPLAAGRVTRGGSWLDVDAVFVSGHTRSWEAPARQDAAVGFRCAKSL